jgi:hypothetical protein
VLTGVDIGDSLACDGLIQGDEAAIDADKAGAMPARREARAEVGSRSGLVPRRHPRRRSPPWQHWTAVASTPGRSRADRLFGLTRRSFGSRRVRYPGRKRSGCGLHLARAAIDRRRAVTMMG